MSYKCGMNNETYTFRPGPAFWPPIDAWRRLQPDLPSRAEAVRRLVALGLKVPGYIAAIEAGETKL